MRVISSSVILLLCTALLFGGLGVVAAQDGSTNDTQQNGSTTGAQGEVTESLTDIETFIATTLSQIGIIVLLLGSAMWFVSSKRSDRAAWGFRAMFGGAGMIILSVSYNVVVALIESFAPGFIAPFLI